MRSVSRSLLATAALCASSVHAFVPTTPTTTRSIQSTQLQASKSGHEVNLFENLKAVGVSAVVAFTILAAPGASFADGQTKEFRLPPIDYSDKNRCVLQGSNMGQANAARDKLYDLRQCKIPNSKAVGLDLSGVIMTNTDLSGSNFQEAYFSKGYLQDSKFDGADFTNAIVDRASFKGSSLRGTIFKNTVLTGTSFEKTDVENADFTDAYLGSFDIRTLCKNPTLKGQNPVTGADTFASVGGCP